MSEAGPRVNGPASPTGKYIDGIDPDDPQYIKNLQRPAEVKEDLQQMENRSRVSVILNSQAFKDELEQVVEEQLRNGPYPASLIALQQITDLLLPQSKGSLGSLARASSVIPINDLRGVESLSFVKGEKLLRCKVASLYRLVDLCGWSHGIHNHISARVSPESEHFLLNPFGLTYSEITASSLVKVDVNGDIVEPGSTHLGVYRTGFSVHSAIHQARPDIKCIVHLHTPSAVAVSALKCGLLAMSQEALICGNVSYHDFHGVAVDADERERLARNLGVHNKILILRNRGVLACGESVEEAFHFTFNVMAACEAQVKAMPVGLDNIVIPSVAAREQTHRVANQGGGGVDSTGRKWKIGELEFEALMRTLDNSGFRTGHVYKMPIVKQEKKERSNSEVEIPPASSSFTYIFDGDYEHSKYVSPVKAAMERQKKAYKAGWLTTPNTYKKTEVDEIGTITPKKITKWVPETDSPNRPGGAIVKIENPNQFAPQGENPREFKEKQKSIKKDYYEERITAGPQSRILEGITWDEAQRAKDGQLSGAGDQFIVVGAASKGIIQRDHQHNAVVYRQYYAANPFENMSEAEIDAYQAEVQRRERGELETSIEEEVQPPVEEVPEEAPVVQRPPEPEIQEPEVRYTRAYETSSDTPVTSRPRPSQGYTVHEDVMLAQLAEKVVRTVIHDALSVAQQGKGQQILIGADPLRKHHCVDHHSVGGQIRSRHRHIISHCKPIQCVDSGHGYSNDKCSGCHSPVRTCVLHKINHIYDGGHKGTETEVTCQEAGVTCLHPQNENLLELSTDQIEGGSSFCNTRSTVRGWGEITVGICRGGPDEEFSAAVVLGSGSCMSQQQGAADGGFQCLENPCLHPPVTIRQQPNAQQPPGDMTSSRKDTAINQRCMHSRPNGHIILPQSKPLHDALKCLPAQACEASVNLKNLKRDDIPALTQGDKFAFSFHEKHLHDIALTTKAGAARYKNLLIIDEGPHMGYLPHFNAPSEENLLRSAGQKLGKCQAVLDTWPFDDLKLQLTSTDNFMDITDSVTLLTELAHSVDGCKKNPIGNVFLPDNIKSGVGGLSKNAFDSYNLIKHLDFLTMSRDNSFSPPEIIAYPVSRVGMPPGQGTSNFHRATEVEGRPRYEAFHQSPATVSRTPGRGGAREVTGSEDTASQQRWAPRQNYQRRQLDQSVEETVSVISDAARREDKRVLERSFGRQGQLYMDPEQSKLDSLRREEGLRKYREEKRARRNEEARVIYEMRISDPNYSGPIITDGLKKDVGNNRAYGYNKNDRDNEMSRTESKYQTREEAVRNEANVRKSEYYMRNERARRNDGVGGERNIRNQDNKLHEAERRPGLGRESNKYDLSDDDTEAFHIDSLDAQKSGTSDSDIEHFSVVSKKTESSEKLIKELKDKIEDRKSRMLEKTQDVGGDKLAVVEKLVDIMGEKQPTTANISVNQVGSIPASTRLQQPVGGGKDKSDIKDNDNVSDVSDDTVLEKRDDDKHRSQRPDEWDRRSAGRYREKSEERDRRRGRQDEEERRDRDRYREKSVDRERRGGKRDKEDREKSEEKERIERLNKEGIDRNRYRGRSSGEQEKRRGRRDDDEEEMERDRYRGRSGERERRRGRRDEEEEDMDRDRYRGRSGERRRRRRDEDDDEMNRDRHRGRSGERERRRGRRDEEEEDMDRDRHRGGSGERRRRRRDEDEEEMDRDRYRGRSGERERRRGRRDEDDKMDRDRHRGRSGERERRGRRDEEEEEMDRDRYRGKSGERDRRRTTRDDEDASNRQRGKSAERERKRGRRGNEEEEEEDSGQYTGKNEDKYRQGKRRDEDRVASDDERRRKREGQLDKSMDDKSVDISIDSKEILKLDDSLKNKAGHQTETIDDTKAEKERQSGDDKSQRRKEGKDQQKSEDKNRSSRKPLNRDDMSHGLTSTPQAISGSTKGAELAASDHKPANRASLDNVIDGLSKLGQKHDVVSPPLDETMERSFTAEIESRFHDSDQRKNEEHTKSERRATQKKEKLKPKEQKLDDTADSIKGLVQSSKKTSVMIVTDLDEGFGYVPHVSVKKDMKTDIGLHGTDRNRTHADKKTQKPVGDYEKTFITPEIVKTNLDVLKTSTDKISAGYNKYTKDIGRDRQERGLDSTRDRHRYKDPKIPEISLTNEGADDKQRFTGREIPEMLPLKDKNRQRYIDKEIPEISLTKDNIHAKQKFTVKEIPEMIPFEDENTQRYIDKEIPEMSLTKGKDGLYGNVKIPEISLTKNKTERGHGYRNVEIPETVPIVDKAKDRQKYIKKEISEIQDATKQSMKESADRFLSTDKKIDIPQYASQKGSAVIVTDLDADFDSVHHLPGKDKRTVIDLHGLGKKKAHGDKKAQKPVSDDETFITPETVKTDLDVLKTSAEKISAGYNKYTKDIGRDRYEIGFHGTDRNRAHEGEKTQKPVSDYETFTTPEIVKTDLDVLKTDLDVLKTSTDKISAGYNKYSKDIGRDRYEIGFHGTDRNRAHEGEKTQKPVSDYETTFTTPEIVKTDLDVLKTSTDKISAGYNKYSKDIGRDRYEIGFHGTDRNRAHEGEKTQKPVSDYETFTTPEIVKTDLDVLKTSTDKISAGYNKYSKDIGRDRYKRGLDSTRDKHRYKDLDIPEISITKDNIVDKQKFAEKEIPEMLPLKDENRQRQSNKEIPEMSFTKDKSEHGHRYGNIKIPETMSMVDKTKDRQRYTDKEIPEIQFANPSMKEPVERFQSTVNKGADLQQTYQKASAVIVTDLDEGFDSVPHVSVKKDIKTDIGLNGTDRNRTHEDEKTQKPVHDYETTFTTPETVKTDLGVLKTSTDKISAGYKKYTKDIGRDRQERALDSTRDKHRYKDLQIPEISLTKSSGDDKQRFTDREIPEMLPLKDKNRQRYIDKEIPDTSATKDQTERGHRSGHVEIPETVSVLDKTKDRQRYTDREIPEIQFANPPVKEPVERFQSKVTKGAELQQTYQKASAVIVTDLDEGFDSVPHLPVQKDIKTDIGLHGTDRNRTYADEKTQKPVHDYETTFITPETVKTDLGVLKTSTDKISAGYNKYTKDIGIDRQERKLDSTRDKHRYKDLEIPETSLTKDRTDKQKFPEKEIPEMLPLKDKNESRQRHRDKDIPEVSVKNATAVKSERPQEFPETPSAKVKSLAAEVLQIAKISGRAPRAVAEDDDEEEQIDTPKNRETDIDQEVGVEQIKKKASVGMKKTSDLEVNKETKATSDVVNEAAVPHKAAFDPEVYKEIKARSLAYKENPTKSHTSKAKVSPDANKVKTKSHVDPDDGSRPSIEKILGSNKNTDSKTSDIYKEDNRHPDTYKEDRKRSDNYKDRDKTTVSTGGRVQYDTYKDNNSLPVRDITIPEVRSEGRYKSDADKDSKGRHDALKVDRVTGQVDEPDDHQLDAYKDTRTFYGKTREDVGKYVISTVDEVKSGITKLEVKSGITKQDQASLGGDKGASNKSKEGRQRLDINSGDLIRATQKAVEMSDLKATVPTIQRGDANRLLNEKVIKDADNKIQKRIKSDFNELRNKLPEGKILVSETSQPTDKTSPKFQHVKSPEMRVSKAVDVSTAPAAVEFTRPATVGLTKPSTVELSLPSTVELSLPSTVELNKPSTVGLTKPSASTVEFTKPSASTVEFTKPSASTVEFTKPSTVELTKPSTVELTKPSTVELTKPSTVELTKSSTVELTKPSTVGLTKPSTIELTKPSTIGLTKSATVELTKPSTVELTKLAADEFTRPVEDVKVNVAVGSIPDSHFRDDKTKGGLKVDRTASSKKILTDVVNKIPESAQQKHRKDDRAKFVKRTDADDSGDSKDKSSENRQDNTYKRNSGRLSKIANETTSRLDRELGRMHPASRDEGKLSDVSNLRDATIGEKKVVDKRNSWGDRSTDVVMDSALSPREVEKPARGDGKVSDVTAQDMPVHGDKRFLKRELSLELAAEAAAKAGNRTSKQVLPKESCPEIPSVSKDAQDVRKPNQNFRAKSAERVPGASIRSGREAERSYPDRRNVRSLSPKDVFDEDKRQQRPESRTRPPSLVPRANQATTEADTAHPMRRNVRSLSPENVFDGNQRQQHVDSRTRPPKYVPRANQARVEAATAYPGRRNERAASAADISNRDARRFNQDSRGQPSQLSSEPPSNRSWRSASETDVPREGKNFIDDRTKAGFPEPDIPYSKHFRDSEDNTFDDNELSEAVIRPQEKQKYAGFVKRTGRGGRKSLPLRGVSLDGEDKDIDKHQDDRLDEVKTEHTKEDTTKLASQKDEPSDIIIRDHFSTVVHENPIEVTVDNDDTPPQPSPKKGIKGFFGRVAGKSADLVRMLDRSKKKQPTAYYEEGEKRKIKKLSKEKEKEEKKVLYFEKSEEASESFDSFDDTFDETFDTIRTSDEEFPEAAHESPPQPPVVEEKPLQGYRSVRHPNRPRESPPQPPVVEDKPLQGYGSVRYPNRPPPFKPPKPLSTFIDPSEALEALGASASEEDESSPTGRKKDLSDDDSPRGEQPATVTVKRSESTKDPKFVEQLERQIGERSKSERRPKPREELREGKPSSPSKSDTMKSTDSASGGETLEDRSSKEGSPTKELPSPTKEKKKKKKFRIPSFSKKKSKENKESAI